MNNILVVDDSGVTRLQVKQILRDTNCVVYEAASGKQVVHNSYPKEFQLDKIDLVLLDLHLDDMEGYEVLESIAERYPKLPVVMLSGERKKESILKCLDLGAKDYIIKPFNKEILISRIRRFFDVISRDELETNTKELSHAIHLEIERCLRSNKPLSFYFFEIPPDESKEQKLIYIIQENLKKTVRIIDNVFIYKNTFVIILPVTDRKGLAMIQEKVSEFMTGTGIKQNLKNYSFVLPDDITDKQLIQNHDGEGIKNIIMQMIMGQKKNSALT